MARFGKLASLLSCALLVWNAAATDVTFFMCYRPTHKEDPATKALDAFAKANPDIHPKQWGGLILPGGGGRAQFMLALAGGSAPDVYKAWFHILRHDIEQGFTYPLDEWIDGEWEGWRNSPPLWREVASRDGHIYAVPTPGMSYYGLLYRKDIVKECGMDPEAPPATWDDFERWCRKLSRPGRRALAIENRPWGFLPWVGAAGGDVVRKKPSAEMKDEWEACFDSRECVRAANFLQRLVRQDLVRGLPVLTVSSDVAEMFMNGSIVCVFGGEDLVAHLTERLNFPADLIGLMPFPAADGTQKPVLQAHKHFYAMTESVAHRPKEERDKVWAALMALASNEVYDERVRTDAREGRARWCMPSDLKRLGLERHLAEVPLGIRKMYDDLEAGRIRAVTEPHVGFWQAASDIVSRRFLGLLLSDSGKDLDCGAALSSITAEANRGLMFDADRSRIEAKRPAARVVFGVLICCALVAFGVALSSHRRKGNPCRDGGQKSSARSFRSLLPWLFLAPAVASIAVWSYYPLIKGAMMAFQDYRIVGDAVWAGLDNFIRVASDPGFWKAWGRTLQYVALTMALGFTAPVVLAVLLTEIPKGKVFFRTVYFLPHLTSALVIMLLWKMMFDPTESGMLNQLLAVFGVGRQSWLQDPAWAMTCCILPGVWAGMGMSSLIYVAALGSLPPDYYEAAAIDGAGIFARLRHITFPQLMPLMVINFVGAFIAAFQGMGSIFLLTFGGPGDATNVLSLAIWKEAYNNLRFSTATTMAWFLGVALIGFTYLQIRILRRVEFRSAAAN